MKDKTKVAEINLLKQKRLDEGWGERLLSIAAKSLIAVLAAIAVYYVFLFIRLGKVNKEVSFQESAISQNKAIIAATVERDELLTRQSQLALLDGLIAKHLYWSDLLPALATSTLKSAAYSGIKANANGTLSMSVTVPSVSDLDKYLQVFDTPRYNSNFSDIRIGSFHKAQSGNNQVIQFDVNMKFNPGLLKYKPSAAGNK